MNTEYTKKEILEMLSKEDNNILSEQKKSTNTQFAQMVSDILTSRNQAHIFHLQTESFAEHKALNDYYDSVIGIFDGIVESYQGKYGIIRNFTCDGVVQYKNNDSTIKYFEKLSKKIEKSRNSVKDSYIQNQIDTVIELINSTIYKLKFLK